MRAFKIILFLLLITRLSLAQKQPSYDEIPVFITVQGIGSEEIPAVIYNEQVFLSVADVFNFLKIRNNTSEGRDSISGFFINEEDDFLINKKKEEITYAKKTFPLSSNDLIKTETNLYLKANFFGQVFGLDCRFNFRSLSVTIITSLELPAIREMRRELMHQNINYLKGQVKADTLIGRSYTGFHFGVADWSIISTQQQKANNDVRANLLLGGVVAGGETTLGLNYNTGEPFSEKQQYYLWRFANNDNNILRQIMIGKIAEQVTSSIFDPIAGVQFTNAPTTFRRSFGTYTISNYTTPGYTVELYVNNVLVDYVKADPSGFYSFQVPLVYGNSVIKTRFYGPWGEQSFKEDNISIPFNFLPLHEFEYKVSGGLVEDSLGSRFAHAKFNYGLFKSLTVGAGVEYLSTVNAGKIMPFINNSLRIGSSLLLSSEFTYGIKNKTIISYRRPSNFYVELNYTTYKKGQNAINVNYLEERKAIIAVPIHAKNIALFSRVTINQIILPSMAKLTSKYTTAEWLLTGTIKGIGTSINTYSLMAGNTDPYTYSNLALTFKLPGKILFTPQAQYQYKQNEFISVKCGLEKGIAGRGFLNMTYEENFKSKFSSVSLGIRYDFSFGQLGITARRTNHITTLIQSARGSLIYDKKTNYIGASNRSAVGRGGIIIAPFLDINGNGIRDMDEPNAPGLKIRVNGGTTQRDKDNNNILISNLEPYTNYLIEMDRNSFDNIAWKIAKPTLSVTIDPNNFKLIEVPVAVVGEVSGTVYLKNETGGQRGLGQIIVCIYNSHSDLMARILTESDGYFSYLGLPPGAYKAQIDKSQLHKLKMTALPISLPFTISTNKDGDVVDGLRFVMEGKK